VTVVEQDYDSWAMGLGAEPGGLLAPIYSTRHGLTFEEQFHDELIRERARREVRQYLDREEADVAAAASIDYAGAVTGADFIFGDDAELEPIWGTSDTTAWAAGEAMMLFGPQGTGKTTIAQQLMKGRLGLIAEVLGMPVVASTKKVLYIAGDRPRQAARAMRRMFRTATPDEQRILAERLVVWKGPLPHNLVERPETLKDLAQHYGCDTVFVDSIKDVVAKLNDEAAGSMYNRAIQLCLVAGVQVCDLHHPRKADSKDGNRPKGVDDVYGSTWLTAGHGSIMSIWGKTGDLVVELSQLKMVNDEVGPLRVEHDHENGVSHIQDRFDLLGAVIRLESITVTAAAELMFETANPSAGQKAKARRALQALVRSEKLFEHEGAQGGTNGGTPAHWTPVPGVTATGGRTGRSVGTGGFGGGGRNVARPSVMDAIDLPF
jgi:replicative DNA helicase